MNLIKFLIFFLVFNFFLKPSHSEEIKKFEIRILAVINNQIITNYDLDQQLKIKKKLEKIKINDLAIYEVLNLMIDEKIKLLEINKENIKIDKKLINLSLYNKIRKEDYAEIEPNIKKYIENKLELNLKWNKLINEKFYNKIDVNIEEINEIVKSKKMKETDKKRLIETERNKKLNIFSKLYLSEIKRNYFIKKYI